MDQRQKLVFVPVPGPGHWPAHELVDKNGTIYAQLVGLDSHTVHCPSPNVLPFLKVRISRRGLISIHYTLLEGQPLSCSAFTLPQGYHLHKNDHLPPSYYASQYQEALEASVFEYASLSTRNRCLAGIKAFEKTWARKCIGSSPMVARRQDLTAVMNRVCNKQRMRRRFNERGGQPVQTLG